MNYYFLLFQFFTIEIWKDIPGYDGKYQVSSFGRVMNMNLGREVPQNNHPKGYKQVGFKYKGKKILTTVHKLVGNNFLSIDPIRKQINHITGIKSFNYWWAIEWCTSKENRVHAILSGLDTNYSNLKKKLIGISLDGNETIEFDSVVDAAKSMNGSDAFISMVCRGERKTAYGYQWKYV